MYCVDMLIASHTDNPCPDSKMINSMLSCGPGHTPILVLACQLTSTNQSLPPVDIAEHLQLELIDHPWQVCVCVHRSLQ